MEYFLKRLCLYVPGTVVNDWLDNGDYQIAFCRGGKGFIAFNDQYGTDLKVTLQVNLTKKSNFEP
jgi:alpha-amylase